MAVKTERGGPASSAARASGKDSVRAGTVEQLSRADRVARGKDARAVTPLESHAEFAPAIADFAETYADQNERDYAALQAAVKDGRAEAATEI